MRYRDHALFAAFALLALGLGAVGIYGVMSFTVAQRSKELGVLRAIGMSRGQIAGMVLLESAVVGATGLNSGLRRAPH